MKILFSNLVWGVYQDNPKEIGSIGDVIGVFRSKKKAQYAADFTNACMKNDPQWRYIIKQILVQ